MSHEFNRDKSTLLCLVCALVAVVHSAHASARDERVAVFRRDAPPSWNEVLTWTAHTRGSVRDLLTPVRRPDAVPMCFESQYVLHGEWAVKRTVVTAGRDRTVLAGKGDVDAWAVGRNGQYAFELLRNRQSQKWLVTNIGDAAGNSSIAAELNDDVLKFFARRCLVVCRCLLPELVADDGFSVLDVTEPDAHGLVRVDCQYTPHEEPWYKFRSGSLWLNPARSWVLVRYSASVVEVNQASPTSYDAVFEYDDNSELPLLKRYKEVMKSPQGKEAHVLIEFSNHEHFDSLPEDEFRLTAFGLPELGIPTPRTNYGWWVSLLVGVACLAAGAWFARRGRLLTR